MKICIPSLLHLNSPLPPFIRTFRIPGRYTNRNHGQKKFCDQHALGYMLNVALWRVDGFNRSGVCHTTSPTFQVKGATIICSCMTKIVGVRVKGCRACVDSENRYKGDKGEDSV